MPEEPTGDDLPAEEDALARYGELIEAERDHRPSEALLWDAYKDTEHQLARAMSLIGTLAPDPAMTEVMLERVTIEDGILGVHIQNPEPFTKLMAWHMREMLDVFGKGAAKNYLSWTFQDPEQGQWQLICVRPDGEAPSEKATRLTAVVEEIQSILGLGPGHLEADPDESRANKALRLAAAALAGLSVEQFEREPADG